MLSLGADSEEDCLNILDALTADTLGCTVFLAHKDVESDARLIRYLEDTADVRIAHSTYSSLFHMLDCHGTWRPYLRDYHLILTWQCVLYMHVYVYVCPSLRLVQMLIEASPLATGPAEEADGMLAVVCRSTRAGILRRRAHLEDADRPVALADDGDATLVARHLFKMRDMNGIVDVVRRL